MNHTFVGIWKAILFLQAGDTFFIASFNLTYISSLIKHIIFLQIQSFVL